MPYSNITFVKIKMELFEDDRFLFDLNDRQKGLYLMLLALAGKTNNAIRNEVGFIKNRLGLSDLDIHDIETISRVYPKLRLKGGYWVFDNFEKTHNYIIGKYQGTPEELQRSAQNKKENKKENKKNTPSGSLNQHQEKIVRSNLASNLKHEIGSEANEVAFKELVDGVAKDLSVNNPASVAIHRSKGKR